MIYSRQFRKMRHPTRPDFRLARVFVHNVVEMDIQGFVVGFVHALEDVEDDAREARGVEVDFLIVGDLPYFAE